MLEPEGVWDQISHFTSINQGRIEKKFWFGEIHLYTGTLTNLTHW